MPLLIKTKGKPDPGAMDNDVLICMDGKPIAGLREVNDTCGIMYGTPIFRTDDDRRVFRAAYDGQFTLDLEVSHPTLGNIKRDFRVVSLENDELAIA